MIDWTERAKEHRDFANECSNISLKKYLLESAKRCDERVKHGT